MTLEQRILFPQTKRNPARPDSWQNGPRTLLYQAGCAICHDAEHRAEMVPDLHTLKHPATADYWTQWITASKPASMMPAFTKSHDGPLNEQQIASLVDYLEMSKGS